MTDAINPDALPDTLAALRAWLKSDCRERDAITDDALIAAADRLFAPPDRDPREQAVVDAARAWHQETDGTPAVSAAFMKLIDACEAAWPTTPAERCAVPRCEAAGTERHTRPFDPALLLCPEHAEWLGGFVP